MPAIATGTDKPMVWSLMGPTASGKTQTAIELAKMGGISLISVDSAMVYRGLNVGTAKPAADVLRRYPHALIDIRDPDETYSVSDFVADADREIARVHDQGKLPILVGGSMLYFRAFRDGLSKLPPADPDVRAQLRKRWQQEGLATLFADLRAVDPKIAKRVDPNNYPRIERALEVHALTGIPLSAWWKSYPGVPVADRLDCEFVQYGITEMDRSLLYKRIEQRLNTMLESGLVEEVEELKKLPGVTGSSISMRSVGYRQVWNFLEAGCGDLGSLRNAILAATRQAARRQLTWLRNWAGLPEEHRLEPHVAVKVLQSLYSRL